MPHVPAWDEFLTHENIQTCCIIFRLSDLILCRQRKENIVVILDAEAPKSIVGVGTHRQPSDGERLYIERCSRVLRCFTGPSVWVRFSDSTSLMLELDNSTYNSNKNCTLARNRSIICHFILRANRRFIHAITSHVVSLLAWQARGGSFHVCVSFTRVIRQHMDSLQP